MPSSAGRVRGVSYGYHDGSAKTSQIILAAVEGVGVYRYFENRWERSNGISLGSTLRSSFVWPNNGDSGVVYLMDLSAGLYRSKDGGKNWVNMWPEMKFNNNDFYNTGYLAAGDSDPTTLFMSCLLYTSPSPRDRQKSRMPSSA